MNGSKPAEYHLEVMHPSSYTSGTTFISTSADTKQIDSEGDFNIIIDSRDILIGTYVIPIRIYTKDYSKTIGLTIDVVPASNAEIEISMDSKIKNLGMDTEILTFVKTKGLELDITQVTQDATKALQQALGQGTVSQTGVNV